jgi:hypothetical protein
MMVLRTHAALCLVVLALAASSTFSRADDTPAPTAPLSSEALSLQGFGAQNKQCREWSDGCSTCLRDEKDAPHCSTPGIACQPTPIVCRQTKAP